MSENTPVHSITYGSIHVSVWRNVTAEGVVYFDLMPSRHYKAKTGWESTTTFRERVCPPLLRPCWTHTVGYKPRNSRRRIVLLRTRQKDTVLNEPLASLASRKQLCSTRKLASNAYFITFLVTTEKGASTNTVSRSCLPVVVEASV